MHQEIIEFIFNQYKQKGYVSEDNVLDALEKNNLSLDEIDYICGELLAMGIIIKNNSVDKDGDAFIYDRSQTDYEEIFRQVCEEDENLRLFIDEIRVIPPPQHREWNNLILQAQNGNKYARERIVLMYLRNVIKTALYHHQRYDIDLSEAIQDGCIGLIIAIRKFKIAKHDNFSQYAPWWIRQYIMRKAEPNGSFLRHPVHYKDKMFSTYDIITQHDCIQCLDQKICPILIQEVSEKLECNCIEAVTFIHSLLPALSCESMIESNENIFNDNRLFEEELDDIIDHEKLMGRLEIVLSTLKDREKKIIELRFGLGRDLNSKTLEEIGTIFGVTRERIRQIESKAIKRLRHPTKSKSIKHFW